MLYSGADDLLLLFIFIIIRANVPDLHARIEFVNDFMYEFKSVTDGYYIGRSLCSIPSRWSLMNCLPMTSSNYTSGCGGAAV